MERFRKRLEVKGWSGNRVGKKSGSKSIALVLTHATNG